jgi:hypothetical protein
MSEDNNKIPFWGEDPNILFDKTFITQFFPSESMSFNQKLNALSRSIIFTGLLLFFITHNFRIVLISIITLILIYVLHNSSNKEGFEFSENIPETLNNGIIQDYNNNPGIDYIRENNIPIEKNLFQLPSSKNPLSNVLVSDYTINPKKKPAAPISNVLVKNEILNKAKQFIQDVNSSQPDIVDKLFRDVNEQLNFEQSLRPFNSNPNTTIPNDQGAFAEFCYGSMTSCKEGNLFACARNLSNHPNI